jgi:NAD(P)-dependent dehydrogenase (short-subunit alcohol dehydrogenase family)
MSKSGVAAMTKSLAVEWGPYGIRLNAIAPGPFPTKGAWERLSPGSSVSADGALDNDALTDRASSGISPMGRVGQMPVLANLATFLMADGCDYLTGEVIAIDGAQWLTGGGTFSRLSQLTEAEWDQIRLMIRGANERDKAARTV